MDTAWRTGSDVIGSRLRGLQPHLTEFRADPHVRHLDAQITTLTADT